MTNYEIQFEALQGLIDSIRVLMNNENFSPLSVQDIGIAHTRLAMIVTREGKALKPKKPAGEEFNA